MELTVCRISLIFFSNSGRLILPSMFLISEKNDVNSLMELRMSPNPPSGLLSPLALVQADALALPVQALSFGGVVELDAPLRGGIFVVEGWSGGRWTDSSGTDRPWTGGRRRTAGPSLGACSHRRFMGLTAFIRGRVVQSTINAFAPGARRFFQ